jgi:uncharacterized membrane protein YadS
MVVPRLEYWLAGHLPGLSEVGFGVWDGTAINDKSTVVAASLIHGQPGGRDRDL